MVSTCVTHKCELTASEKKLDPLILGPLLAYETPNSTFRNGNLWINMGNLLLDSLCIH